MPSTYVSLYYHIVFSTKLSRACIRESWQERLQCYLGSVLRGLNGFSRKKTFQEEFLDLLPEDGIEYDERFSW